jgi:hypothetical protein
MSVRAKDPVDRILRRLYGKPCWQAQKGYSSVLTFDFGTPRIEIREPLKKIRAKSPRVRQVLSRRDALVRGEWYLFIYVCTWTLSLGRKVLARSRSRQERIEWAARELRGQALTRATIDRHTGATTFFFDFGGKLELRRMKAGDELWTLWTPGRRVLSIRGDGAYSYQPSDGADRFLPRR